MEKYQRMGEAAPAKCGQLGEGHVKTASKDVHLISY